MESSELYLAADSGGTKTDWAAFDRTGKVILNGRTEGLAGLNHAPASFTQFELQTVKFAALKPKAVYLSLGGPNTGEVEGFLRKRYGWHRKHGDGRDRRQARLCRRLGPRLRG